MRKHIEFALLLLIGGVVALTHGCAKEQSDTAGTTTQTNSNATTTVALANIATVTFPADAFTGKTDLAVETTTDSKTDENYKASSAIFLAGTRSSYEVRVTTTSAPKGNVDVILNVPDALISGLKPNEEIQLLGQLYQDGGLAALDIFEIFPSSLDATNKTIVSKVPDVVFTNKRRAGVYEAVFLLATTPTKPATTVSIPNLVVKSYGILEGAFNVFCSEAFAQTSKCDGVSIEPPLSGDFLQPCAGLPATNTPCVAHDFAEPRSGGTRVHGGLDIATPVGTAITAAHEGKVQILQNPNGYGLYIIIAGGAGQTLYGHLSQTSVAAGVVVKKGDVIGLSGGQAGDPNAGSSKGPHLHWEYAPKGDILSKKSRVDPAPCVNKNIQGSITVSDNGSLADDAFRVAIDSNVICETAIGAANSCATGSLVSGQHALTLTVIVAPDNVGTYLVTLSQGITFSDGSLSRSGGLPQGGSTSFSILVP